MLVAIDLSHTSLSCQPNKTFSYSPFVLFFYWSIVALLVLVSVVQQNESAISSVQLLSRVRFFTTPWTAARQASLFITNSRNLLKLMSIESVMPSNHLILCHPLLLLPSVFPSIRDFSNELVLRIRWPKY